MLNCCQFIVGGFIIFKPNSLQINTCHLKSAEILAKDLYSNFALDLETIDCFLDF